MKKQKVSWFWVIVIAIIAGGYYHWAKGVDKRYEYTEKQNSFYISQGEFADKTKETPTKGVMDCSSHVGTFRF